MMLIPDSCESLFDVVAYTSNKLKDAGCDQSDIEEYIFNVVKKNQYEAIQFSNSYLCEVFELTKAKEDDYLKESIYGAWDNETYDDIQACEQVNRRKYYWEDDLDEVGVDEEPYNGISSDYEYYEGFSDNQSCSYYSCNEDIDYY